MLCTEVKIQEKFLATKSKLPIEIVLAGLLMPSLIWAFRDQHVWPFDQAWYGEVTTSLWIVLTRHPKHWLQALLNSFGAKAPAIAWLGQFFVPLSEITHRIEPALLLSVLLAQLGTLILLCKIGQKLCPNSLALPFVGSLFASSMPLFIAMSHQYMVEPWQTFATTYFYWIALKSPDWPCYRTFGHMILAGFFGLLVKASTPLYCAIPVALTMWDCCTKLRQKGLQLREILVKDWLLLIVAFIVAVLTLGWYQINFVNTWTHVHESAMGAVALNYGHQDIFWHKLIWWGQVLLANFSMPYIWWLLVAIVAAALVVFLKQKTKIHSAWINDRNNQIGFAACISIMLVLSVFSTTINEEQRYLMALLPSIVILVFLVTKFLANKWVNALIMIASAFQLCFIHAQAQNLLPQDRHICNWLSPVVTDKVPKREIDRLVALTSNVQTANRYNICGVELPWLNANSLSFYAAVQELKTHKRAYFTSLGYAEENPERAFKRLNDLHTVYFISLDGTHAKIPTDIFNQVSANIVKRLLSNKKWIKVAFPSNLGIIVFKNTRD